MGIITAGIGRRPYTGVKNVKGKVRVKTHDEAPWLDNYFNGSPRAVQVTGVTRGKVYEVVCVEGFGDCEDIMIIDDNGQLQRLGSFFFEIVN